MENENLDLKTENEIEETSPAEVKTPVKVKTRGVNKRFVLALSCVVVAVVLYGGFTNGKFDKYLNKETIEQTNKILGRQQIMTKDEAKAFIEENLLQEGMAADVKEVAVEQGLYRIKLIISGQEYTSYLTQDKQLFFAQGLVVSDLKKQKQEADKQQKEQEGQAKAEQEKAIAEMAKTDKPTVELFVMSHCPYGTQIEKGIIPVVKALGNKIDFKLKFCDYAMHGDKELKEEVNQYCISQNYPDKLIPYLECFLADENSSDKCLAQAGIDANKIKSCASSTDTKYKITANAADKSTYKSGTYPAFPIFQADVDKYQVQGSPTLVINGKNISSSRDPQSLLKTICSGFANAPQECSQTLNSTAPSAGFGYGSSGNNSSASCGS